MEEEQFLQLGIVDEQTSHLKVPPLRKYSVETQPEQTAEDAHVLQPVIKLVQAMQRLALIAYSVVAQVMHVDGLSVLFQKLANIT